MLTKQTVYHAQFEGLATAGPISLPGTAIGDVLLITFGNNFNPPGADPGTWFEKVVTVADEIQQVVNGADGITWDVYVFRDK